MQKTSGLGTYHFSILEQVVQQRKDTSLTPFDSFEDQSLPLLRGSNNRTVDEFEVSPLTDLPRLFELSFYLDEAKRIRKVYSSVRET